jgi:hypothetical protein
MEIRALEQSDIKSFLDFYQKLATENDYIKVTPEEMSSKFEKEEHKIVQKHNYKQIFIAIDDNEIVGYLALKRLHFARLRHVAKFDLGVLEDYQEEKYENIAIITKDKEELNIISPELKKRTNILAFNKSDIVYRGGKVLIPSYYAKGLEFDAVIMLDFNDETDNLIKYIMTTRALHRLSVIKVR